jgi:methanogenic corrinoid protein MtbC1
MDLIWPIMTEVEKLHRKGKITPAQEHLASRLNRTIVDQLQNKLPRKEEKEKKITICCASDEIQELGAQMTSDLFESEGWEVKFLGGGLTNDDILKFVNNYAPDILLIYGTRPKQAPAIRKLIDTIREINAHPEMRIMVSGGLFNRAEGLWQEIGADLFARDAQQAVQQARTDNRSTPEQRTINRRKLKNTQKQTA